MKNLGEKIFGWMKVSNRPSHIKAGVCVFAAMFLLQVFLFGFLLDSFEFSDSLAQMMYLIISITSAATVFGCMCTCEYVQKKGGGKFDWLDILTGCLPGIVTTVIMGIAVWLV